MSTKKVNCREKEMHYYTPEATASEQFVDPSVVLSCKNESHLSWHDSKPGYQHTNNCDETHSQEASVLNTQCTVHRLNDITLCAFHNKLKASNDCDQALSNKLSRNCSSSLLQGSGTVQNSVADADICSEPLDGKQSTSCEYSTSRCQRLPRIPSVVVSDTTVNENLTVASTLKLNKDNPVCGQVSVLKCADPASDSKPGRILQLAHAGESNSSVESNISDCCFCHSQQSCDSAYSSSMDTGCSLQQDDASVGSSAADNDGSMDNDEAAPTTFSSGEGSPNHKPCGLSVHVLRKNAYSPFSSSSSVTSDVDLPPGSEDTASSNFSLKVESLPRKFSSSSSNCSLRSSLSLEESEEDFISSDENCIQNNMNRRHSKVKAQNSWTKIRRMVIWAPFMQSFKKKYPWVQLAGHAGSFQPGEEGCILKKYVDREAECLRGLSSDTALQALAPTFHGVVEVNSEKYTRMQDLLLPFDGPSLMDCKMGVRTYLEDELVKAKVKPRLRHDMYQKMVEVSPDEPTADERQQRAVTKPRYMQWREHISSTSNLGFRIEGIKKSDREPSKNYKLTKTAEQVTDAFMYFIDGNVTVLEKYIARLKSMRLALEKSDFFHSHEVIGSSLLFVHDPTCEASVWMIDFGKTSRLPNGQKLDHRTEWMEGNREDGYLFGMDNMINLFGNILAQLKQAAKSSPPEEASVHRVTEENITASPRTNRKALRRQDAHFTDDDKTKHRAGESRTT